MSPSSIPRRVDASREPARLAVLEDGDAASVAELIEERGSMAAYFWSWEPAARDRPRRVTRDVLMTMSTTAQSTALSKDLKKRGWTFVGPTTCYAFMQAMGLVNDHIEGCGVRKDVERVRTTFTRPIAG